jgi:hypothetical protein
MTTPTPPKAISFEGFHSEEELHVLRAIVAREDAVDSLLESCCSFEQEISSVTVEILAAILTVRARSLDVIDKLAAWRRRMVQTQPFLWRKTNYLLQMCSDLDFLSRSQLVANAMDGVRIAKRNPFTTVGGLDQSMRFYWQHDLPEEDDLHVLLDSTVYTKGTMLDEPSRIRLSEWLLILEEKRFGRRAKSDALLDVRLKTLIQKEAEFASKKKFGLVQQHVTTE